MKINILDIIIEKDKN